MSGIVDAVGPIGPIGPSSRMHFADPVEVVPACLVAGTMDVRREVTMASSSTAAVTCNECLSAMAEPAVSSPRDRGVHISEPARISGRH